MKRATVLGLMCLFLGSSLRTQEHAPTIEVCRADRAVWDNTEQETDYLQQETKHVNDGMKNKNPIAKISYRELNLRIMQMVDCMSVDQQNSDKYYELHQFYATVTHDRYRGFIVRHHLFEQFKAEDAAGAR